jgi:hypothetical protein
MTAEMKKKDVVEIKEYWMRSIYKERDVYDSENNIANNPKLQRQELRG